MLFRGSMRLCVLHQSSVLTVSEAGSRMRRARRRARGRILARPHVLDNHPPLVLRSPGQRAVAERVAQEQHATAAAHKLQIRDKSRSCPSQRRHGLGAGAHGLTRRRLCTGAPPRHSSRGCAVAGLGEGTELCGSQRSRSCAGTAAQLWLRERKHRTQRAPAAADWTLTSRRPLPPRRAAPTAR